MGPSQPHQATGPPMTDTPLWAPSFSRGRAWEQRHPQQQSMGNLPTTYQDYNAQGKQPIHEDTSHTTSRLALHELAQEAFGTMELDELRELHSLHECFSNLEKMLNEIEGQLFPEFDRTEHPCTIHILGEEWAEGNLKALFFQLNNKLYAYIDNAAWQAYGNIHIGVPPPLLPRRTMRMLEGRMGPMLLHNMAYKIRKLYVRAAQEEPHCAPNVQEAQDLNSYLHLWNAHKQEKSNLICIVMKGWRPPVWATKAMKQKKLALRERVKAQAAQQRGSSLPQHRLLAMMDTLPERSSLTSSGTVPTPHLPSLRDWLVLPEPGEVAMQEAAIDQCPHHLPTAKLLPHTMVMSSAATIPAKRKGKGKSKPNNDLPPDAPPLSADADTASPLMWSPYSPWSMQTVAYVT